MNPSKEKPLRQQRQHMPPKKFCSVNTEATNIAQSSRIKGIAKELRIQIILLLLYSTCAVSIHIYIICTSSTFRHTLPFSVVEIITLSAFAHIYEKGGDQFLGPEGTPNVLYPKQEDDFHFSSTYRCLSNFLPTILLSTIMIRPLTCYYQRKKQNDKI